MGQYYEVFFSILNSPAKSRHRKVLNYFVLSGPYLNFYNFEKIDYMIEVNVIIVIDFK